MTPSRLDGPRTLVGYLERHSRQFLDTWPRRCTCGSLDQSEYTVQGSREKWPIVMWQCTRCGRKKGPAVAHPTWIEGFYAARAARGDADDQDTDTL